MIPLEVTHTVLSNPGSGADQALDLSLQLQIIQLLAFFASTYKGSFQDARASVHDPVAIFAHVIRPGLSELS
jgi:inosine-uridine nucleoside N-ribohydrolase